MSGTASVAIPLLCLRIIPQTAVPCAAQATVPPDALRSTFDGGTTHLCPPPVAFFSGASERAWRQLVHGDLDARARALGIAIGNKLAHDPSLISRTKARLSELLEEAAPYEQRELREWLRILETTSLPRLRHLLADPGERGTRLRQSLPFLDVLTAEERDHAIDSADDA